MPCSLAIAVLTVKTVVRLPLRRISTSFVVAHQSVSGAKVKRVDGSFVGQTVSVSDTDNRCS